MTELLHTAFDRASKLPPEVQDELARQLLDDLANEERWLTAFDHASHALNELADEAIADNRANRTQPLDPDSL